MLNFIDKKHIKNISIRGLSIFRKFPVLNFVRKSNILSRWFDKLYDKKISASGLAVFRITFFLNLFFEVIHIFNYRQLYFDEIPFLITSSFDMTFPLLFWGIVLLFIVFGCFTRIMAIINYLFCFFVLSSFTDFEYHMHYVYVGISFLTIFLPVSRVLSIDALYVAKNKFVSVLYYYLPVLVGIGFVYFDSVFHKFTSNIWMNGLGVWYPASLPYITILGDQWLLNQKWMMLFLGYFTLFFEAIFIFVFWNKKIRLPFVIIGVCLHLGILLEFPIPYFALGVIAIYTLMIPVGFWDKIIKKNRKYILVNIKNKELYKKTNDTQFPKIIMKTLLGICIFFQINITLQSPLVSSSVNSIVNKLHIHKYYKKISNKLTIFSRKTLGITMHPVFMDNHFVGYNHILKVTYIDDNLKETILPIINDDGMPGDYLTGGIWINWSYRTNNPNVNIEILKHGVISYTSFWAHSNDVTLNDAKFKISVKKIKSLNSSWKSDYLIEQLNVSWEEAGYLVWGNSGPTLKLIKDIEEF